MPFPALDETFPSADWALAFAQYAENDAWYSGDQSKLSAVYSGTGGAATRGDDPATHFNKADGTWRRGGLRGFASRFFNGKVVDPASGQQHTRIHTPVAGNLARLSSDLLMAEPPTFRIYNEAGKSFGGRPSSRSDKVLNSERTQRTLSAAAEDCAGISAVVLTAHWDRDVSDVPWLQHATADAAVPEFVGGRLAAVNLYTVYHVTTGDRLDYSLTHVERHEPGYIVHGLLRINELGKTIRVVPLQDRPETEHLASIAGAVAGPLEGTIALPTGIRSLTAAWWRHLPTKTFRKSGRLSFLGRAVFEGSEQLLDAVDEVWSSWMRDIKIARARLIVPQSFLESQGAGLGGAFDDDAEILTALEYTNLGGDDQQMISAHQFAIRAEEHASTLLALTREITQHAGYSLSSYAEQASSGGMTATEVTDRTTMTERTRDRQRLYFIEAADPIAHALMELDRVHYGGAEIPNNADLRIEIPDLSQIDPEKEARVFQSLRIAMAASTRTLVVAQHPEWEDDQIDAEVEQIRLENNLGGGEEVDPGAEDRVPPVVPDPTEDPDPEADPEDEQ